MVFTETPLDNRQRSLVELLSFVIPANSVKMSGKICLNLLPDQDLGALGEVPVFMGGPVSTDKLAFAALKWNKRRRTLRCQTHLSVADALHALSLGHDVRGFVGYSGWSGGQLESELELRSWITASARPLVLTVEKPTQMWGAVLADMGPVYKVMAGMPEDVGLN